MAVITYRNAVRVRVGELSRAARLSFVRYLIDTTDASQDADPVTMWDNLKLELVRRAVLSVEVNADGNWRKLTEGEAVDVEEIGRAVVFPMTPEVFNELPYSFTKDVQDAVELENAALVSEIFLAPQVVETETTASESPSDDSQSSAPSTAEKD